MSLYCPRGQATGDIDGDGQYDPMGQSVHIAEFSAEYDPVGHNSGTSDGVGHLYPAGQGVLIFMSVEAQRSPGLQVYTTFPKEQTEPIGQGEHTAPPSIEYSRILHAIGGLLGSAHAKP